MHQRIDEQPDQPFQFGTSTPGNRAADDNLGLAGKTREQRTPGGQQSHVQRHTLALRQRTQTCGRQNPAAPGVAGRLAGSAASARHPAPGANRRPGVADARRSSSFAARPHSLRTEWPARASAAVRWIPTQRIQPAPVLRRPWRRWWFRSGRRRSAGAGRAPVPAMPGNSPGPHVRRPRATAASR